MPMETVQIRLTSEQLKLIDKKVRAGEYPSRSEAIRDFVRKAELFELLGRFLNATERQTVSGAQLERVRERVWKEKFAPRLKRRGSVTIKG